MSHLRRLVLSTVLVLAAAHSGAAQQNGYGGYDIVAAPGNERFYAETRGWNVFAAQMGGGSGYCFGETRRSDGSAFRLGWDGMQWQLAVPLTSPPEWEGTLQVDGAGAGQGYRSGGNYISGTASGGWTIAWLGEAELDGLRKGGTAVLGVGKFDYDFALSGSTAVILKVQECVGIHGRTGAAAPPPAGPSGAAGGMIEFATARPAPQCYSTATGGTSGCTLTQMLAEPGFPRIVQVDLPGYVFLVRIADARLADVWWKYTGDAQWTWLGNWGQTPAEPGCIEAMPLERQASEAVANLGQDYWKVCVN